MTSDPRFLDWLREARAGEGRGNEELVRAIVPLLEQLATVHEVGRVGPMDQVSCIHADGGHLYFLASDARDATLDLAKLREIQGSRGDNIEVVGHGRIDISETGATRVTTNVHREDEPLQRPIYVAGYSSWEAELGHHDALTDIFAAGMLMASLAVGCDFTEPDELQTFISNRHQLSSLNASLHPVIARAIVRMTELDRHKRVQDLPALIQRLVHYREVDERVDTELDFARIEGFVNADRSSRRHIVQTALQARLFDISRRNRMIYFKPTLQMIDLTVASVPTQLAVETIRADELFLWDGPAGRELTDGKPIRLDRYLRVEESPWIQGTLDKVRSEDRRSRAEVGFSQLRLVIGFLNWHNLKDAKDERIRSPLLLLPVELALQRGVRTSTVLTPMSELAEVNPVLRHHLKDLYDLDLPEQVDLKSTDVATFHKVLAAAITRSEPGVTVHLWTRPQIRLMRETARRRMTLWRRRSNSTGRGLRSALGVDFSYSKSNLQPLGLALFREKVKTETFFLEEHLQTATPVLPDFAAVESPEQPEDSDVTVSKREVYQRTEAAAGPYDWAVDLTHCTLGNFNYRKMSLVRDYSHMLDDDDDHEHPSFDALFSLDARDLATTPEAEHDMLDLFGVVPSDPTQAAAIRWARTGQSFIIQGPPGTGKSQTITNLIADFAAHGKRVLFVCQKRAALDVVYHRLTQHKLDELSVLIHDSQGDKKAFIADLKGTYRDWSQPGSIASEEPARSELIASMREPLTGLARFAEGMTAPIHGGDLSFVEAINHRLSQVASPALDAATAEQLPTHRAWSTSRAAVHDAARSLVAVGESPVLARLSLRAIGADILEAPRPIAALTSGLDQLGALLDEVQAALSRVGPDATSADLTEALALAQDLAPLLPNQLGLLDPDSARSLQLDGLLADRRKAQAALAEARQVTENWQAPLSAADTSTALAQSRAFDAVFVLFRWLNPAWWALRRIVLASYDFAAHAVQPGYTGVLEDLSTVYEREGAVVAIEQRAAELFDIEGSPESFMDALATLRDTSKRTPLQRSLLLAWRADPSAVQAVLDAQRAIDQLRTTASTVFDDGHTLSHDALSTLVSDARRAVDLLPEVMGALRQLLQADPTVRHAVRNLPYTPDEWDAAITQAAIDATLRQNRPLARFSTEVLTTRQRALNDAHHALLALNARVIIERVRCRFQERLRISQLPSGELSDDEKVLKKSYNAGRRVLEREFDKVMRHRSIRDLSEGDTGAVVYDLKPIWLMSPLSISDTIPLTEQRFDVVIFDEASQIPLEEAVPAVYRAPQMIVVGDEQQLPPTSFFSAARSDDPDEDSVEATYDLDADSFLSHSSRKLASTMLGWHYRSRHEALIRFSNQAFYDGELRTVPDRLRDVEREAIEVSDVAEGDARAANVLDRPVSYHRLDASPYMSRTNLGEATYIAHLVRGLLNSGNGATIGIVAFSEAQQGAIESALDRLASEDSAFRRALDVELEREDDGQLVGLFVKNLENVQGDERDIIILSICYGPDSKGKMRMNFGPINKGGGEKRLNVVFSRAKRHMAVVTSIEHAQITNQYNDGALCLRRYLQYADAASRGDDVAADSVMNALRRADVVKGPSVSASEVVNALAERLLDEGLVVTRDLGASDFRVDLAVGKDDEEAMAVAVLIDTPQAYVDHDPFEAYHIRPSVLRGFGWTVLHVLSKDWIGNEDSIVARVLRAIDDPEAFALPEPSAPPPPPEREEPAEDDEASNDPGELSLVGATVVFTGTLKTMNRDDAEALVRELGGRPAKSISRRTRFVVAGKRAGSTLDKAKAADVPVIDEAAFIKLIAAAKTANAAEAEKPVS